MNELDPGQVHGQFAADYDRLTRDYHCYAAEVLFGLTYEYVSPGECLLDVGIGTGLSSVPFAKAGLAISGLDASEAMLTICRSKNIALELKQADIAVTPWPYAPRSFDHVLACGVLHFLEDLDSIFKSASRAIRASGVFAFTTKVEPRGGPPVVRYETEGIAVFLHSREYVAELAARHGFELLKEMQFIVGDEQAARDDLFNAFVTRYTSTHAVTGLKH